MNTSNTINTLNDVMSDIRNFMYGGMVSLPLTLAGTMLILGLFTGNYAFLFFLLGFLVITPVLSNTIDFLFKLVMGPADENSLFKGYVSDICKIHVPYTTREKPVGVKLEQVSSSTWVAMISFFTGYVFINGFELYRSYDSEKGVEIPTNEASSVELKVLNRKSRVLISMISIIIFFIFAMVYRFKTGCEAKFIKMPIGMIPTMTFFTFIGYMWYKAFSSIAQDKLSDIFGIANRLLPSSAITNAPIACIPIRK